jgi:putative Mn2+ efflux pump MntP
VLFPIGPIYVNIFLLDEVMGIVIGTVHGPLILLIRNEFQDEMNLSNASKSYIRALHTALHLSLLVRVVGMRLSEGSTASYTARYTSGYISPVLREFGFGTGEPLMQALG